MIISPITLSLILPSVRRDCPEEHKLSFNSTRKPQLRFEFQCKSFLNLFPDSFPGNRHWDEDEILWVLFCSWWPAEKQNDQGAWDGLPRAWLSPRVPARSPSVGLPLLRFRMEAPSRHLHILIEFFFFFLKKSNNKKPTLWVPGFSYCPDAFIRAMLVHAR